MISTEIKRITAEEARANCSFNCDLDELYIVLDDIYELIERNSKAGYATLAYTYTIDDRYTIKLAQLAAADLTSKGYLVEITEINKDVLLMISWVPQLRDEIK